MVLKSATRLVAVLILALLLALTTTVQAQDDACPGSINGADCTLLQEALAHIATSTSYEINIDFSTVIEMGNIMSQELTASGWGQVVVNEAGEATAIDIRITEGGFSQGGFFSGGGTEGATRFIFVDGMLYFGMGPDIDTLTWQSIETDVTAIPVASAMPLNYFARQPGVIASWSRMPEDLVLDDGLTLAQFSAYYSTNSAMTEGLALLGGMSGDTESESATNAMFGSLIGMGFDSEFPSLTEYLGEIYVDPETNEFRGFGIVVSLQVDMSNVMGDDLLSAFVGTTGSMYSQLVIAFADYDQDYEIEAPAEATPASDGITRLAESMSPLGLYPMLNAYYSQMGAVGGFGMTGTDAPSATAVPGAVPTQSDNTGVPATEIAPTQPGNTGVPDPDTPLARGEAAVDEINLDTLGSGERHAWTFMSDSDQQAIISLNSPDFDTYLELLGPNGERVAANDDYDGLNSQITTTLTTPGEYTIIARGYSSSGRGDYELSLSLTTVEIAPPGGGPIDYGESQQANLRTNTPDMWAFSGNSGDVVTINMDSPEFDTYLELQDAAGATIATNDDYNGLNSQIDFTLPATGEYTIIARGYSSSATGTYTLSLQAEIPATPEPLADGSIRQWATGAEATSQYSDPRWSAMQATGAPDTNRCGDIATAWASASSRGQDTLTVFFATPVRASMINIHQTYNPGSIVRVELIPANGGTPVTVPNSADPPGNTPCPGIFSLDVSDVDAGPISGVQIVLDQTIGGSWNEIDAVELIGVPVE